MAVLLPPAAARAQHLPVSLTGMLPNPYTPVQEERALSLTPTAQPTHSFEYFACAAIGLLFEPEGWSPCGSSLYLVAMLLAVLAAGQSLKNVPVVVSTVTSLQNN